MGYTTNFEGNVKTDKPVSKEIYDLINGLAKTRRMKRNITGFGVEGEFYYDPKSFAVCGQSWDDNTIEDSNKPPRTQPSLWLQWVVQPDRHTIEWDGSEKFYGYIEWMEYLIDKILEPAGYIVNGSIFWSGEEVRDNGTLIVEDNKVRVE